MASSLSTIDELTRGDHTFLSTADECYYLGEYTSRAGDSFSETNRLIQNLKKPMDRKGKPEWTHKEQAILKFGQQLRIALNDDFLGQATLIPVPPSSKVDDPNYDDRMLRVLRTMQASDQFDIREIVTMRINLDPVHLHDGPRSVENLVKAFK